MWLGWAQVRYRQIILCYSVRAVDPLIKMCTYLMFSSHFLTIDGGDWGLDEKDMEASVATVRSMCEQLDADLITLRERNEAAGLVRDYLIRRRVGELDFLEVR